MTLLWEELTAGLSDSDHLLRVVIRLVAAILCGGLIGLQREGAGKSAGLRTHALVSLGTTIVVVTCSVAGMSRWIVEGHPRDRDWHWLYRCRFHSQTE
jgi:putative Mg2+ transporter-C (MgtC) family protein